MLLVTLYVINIICVINIVQLPKSIIKVKIQLDKVLCLSKVKH